MPITATLTTGTGKDATTVFSPVTDTLSNLAPILQQVAFGCEALIKNRVVRKGKDVNDQPFAPYSKRYEATKAERGDQWYKAGLVNLFDTGRMMGAVLDVVTAGSKQSHAGAFADRVVSPSSIILYISGGPAAYGLKLMTGDEAAHLPAREWFGLTESEKLVMADEFQRYVLAALGATQ
jgi:hypothetical protein